MCSETTLWCLGHNIILDSNQNTGAGAPAFQPVRGGKQESFWTARTHSLAVSLCSTHEYTTDNSVPVLTFVAGVRGGGGIRGFCTVGRVCPSVRTRRFRAVGRLCPSVRLTQRTLRRCPRIWEHPGSACPVQGRHLLTAARNCTPKTAADKKPQNNPKSEPQKRPSANASQAQSNYKLQIRNLTRSVRARVEAMVQEKVRGVDVYTASHFLTNYPRQVFLIGVEGCFCSLQ